MSRQCEHPLIRAIALVAALCVFALAVFAASPEMHARLHGSDMAGQTAPVGDAGHVCAVTLFSHGVTALLVFCLLMLGRSLAAGIIFRTVDEIAAAYLENLKAQFGDAVELSDEFRWEWVSIPHIYATPFYVYAYAFGQLLVADLRGQNRIPVVAAGQRHGAKLRAGA